MPPLQRGPKPDSISGTGDREGRPYGVFFTCSEQRVQGAAPCKERTPPLRAATEAVPPFRRGWTLAAPLRGFCHFGAHPHPPRFARHLPPWRGKARAADSRPYGGYRGYSLISQGPVPDRPTGGASPSPTNLKKAFQTWVGEPLGAPARIRTGSICSTKPGAVVEPHRRQFLNSQPPVGRREFR